MTCQFLQSMVDKRSRNTYPNKNKCNRAHISTNSSNHRSTGHNEKADRTAELAPRNEWASSQPGEQEPGEYIRDELGNIVEHGQEERLLRRVPNKLVKIGLIAEDEDQAA